ncbi:MAG TPA: hypothetical protein VHU80_02075, partial [Polyangiaceae bacterium]|nr:hypothetical protein [Polyangiaceae bacterium]
MKTLSNRLGFALAGIATTVIGMSAIGCSSSKSGDGDTGMNTNNGGTGSTSQAGTCANSTLSIAFPTMYSAFIPNSNHTFKLPVTVNGVSCATVTWSSSDDSKVIIDPGGADGCALLTMKGSGDVNIIATAGSACGSAPLHITAATEDQWTAGNARYNNMNALPS